jgi:hypothetical protein
MLFGVWNKARDNKESIFYAVLTVFLLERVRTAWNKIASNGRKHEIEPRVSRSRQSRLLIKAALLYALPLLLPVLKYIYRSIEELSWSVQGLMVLKGTWAFLIILVITEFFLALIVYNLLRIYIDRMNAAIGFFTKIGRNIWDGSRMAVQVGSSRFIGGVRTVSTASWSTMRTTVRKTGTILGGLPAAIAGGARRQNHRRNRQVQELEGSRS